MAILKHMASRNSHYNDIVEYLLYDHEDGGKKILTNEFGNPILREGMLIDGIGCTPYDFETECIRVNEKYGKNNTAEEIKFHSYIISFDPRDAEDNNLTKEEVQKFGIEFTEKFLPGHQAIICTHSDGNNNSGNLHCHIVINSLRCEDVEPQPFMERPIDSRAGYKHHLTNEFERVLKDGVMQMCFERGLYQVNLLDPARTKITQKEYFAERKGIQNEGMTFETRKQFLRNAIEHCAVKSSTVSEFKEMMKTDFDITVKESRGRFSYIIPGREKAITGRQLGSQYLNDFIEKVLRNETSFVHETEYFSYERKEYVPLSVLRIVDISKNEKAKASSGYEQAVILSNLKKKAKTFNYLTEHGLDSIPKMNASLETLKAELKATDDRIHFYSGMSNGLTHQENLRNIHTLIEKQSEIRKDIRDLENAKFNILQILGKTENPKQETKKKMKDRDEPEL